MEAQEREQEEKEVGERFGDQGVAGIGREGPGMRWCERNVP